MASAHQSFSTDRRPAHRAQQRSGTLSQRTPYAKSQLATGYRIRITPRARRPVTINASIANRLTSAAVISRPPPPREPLTSPDHSDLCVRITVPSRDPIACPVWERTAFHQPSGISRPCEQLTNIVTPGTESAGIGQLDRRDGAAAQTTPSSRSTTTPHDGRGRVWLPKACFPHYRLESVLVPPDRPSPKYCFLPARPLMITTLAASSPVILLPEIPGRRFTAIIRLEVSRR